MKTLLSISILIFSVICFVACEKEQEKEISTPKPTSPIEMSALVEARNQSSRNGDIIHHVFFHSSDASHIGFPLEKNHMSAFSTSLGKKTLHIAMHSVAGGSISVIDSDNRIQCKSIGNTGNVLVSFDSVVCTNYQKVSITFKSAVCD